MYGYPDTAVYKETKKQISKRQTQPLPTSRLFSTHTHMKKKNKSFKF
ncbi:hypothetical protein FWK35_00011085 [Aphis craccivora]|uniref:Uncharacterized protein n=1 Tax=Aphis craccivora TaxID=307492 RepID=A0A6G0ZKR7_APHCR|nr:hypothetical protein FWK35_00011085 [Aphis craccivora]